MKLLSTDTLCVAAQLARIKLALFLSFADLATTRATQSFCVFAPGIFKLLKYEFIIRVLDHVNQSYCHHVNNYTY